MSLKYVLMLENDSEDRYITQSTLTELNITVPVRYEYWSPLLLHSINKNDQPALILLAYNTAPENGLNILKAIRTNHEYAHIQVVVLAEEMQSELIRKYYLAGASTIIKKPASSSLTTKKIETFFSYWFEVAEL